MTDRPIVKLAPLDLPTDINVEERLTFLQDQIAALTAPAQIVSLSTIPAPQITSALQPNGVGLQFTFNQLSLGGIDGYRVYRNTTSSFAGSTIIQYLKHAALTTTAVTVSDPVPANTARYYWVTAVSTSGLESAPAAAQATTVNSGSVVASDGSVSFNGGVSVNGTLVIDTNANLLLKNKLQAIGSTSNPTTQSTTFVTLPEMSVTLTTHGNKVMVIFSGVFTATGSSTGSTQLFLAIFADGTQVSPVYDWDINPDEINYNKTFSVVYLDSPTAASHTYTVGWKWSGSISASDLAVGTQRTMQVIELG